MSDLGSGIRIRLDLSSVESGSSKQFRWAYLPYSNFSTITDLKNYVRNHCLADPKPKIRLFLEEPFWLPASENIRILQNGDLVTVKTRCEPEIDTQLSSNQGSDPAVAKNAESKDSKDFVTTGLGDSKTEPRTSRGLEEMKQRAASFWDFETVPREAGGLKERMLKRKAQERAKSLRDLEAEPRTAEGRKKTQFQKKKLAKQADILQLKLAKQKSVRALHHLSKY